MPTPGLAWRLTANLRTGGRRRATRSAARSIPCSLFPHSLSAFVPFPTRVHQRLLMTKLPKAMPTFQPLPFPLSASDTLPLVTTWAFADLPAPACASAEA